MKRTPAAAPTEGPARPGVGGPANAPMMRLYRDAPDAPGPQPLHCESIAERSRRYRWEIEPHRHAAFVQLLHVRRGGGTAQLGGQQWPIRPPCVIAVPPGLVHGFRFDADTDGVVITALSDALEPGLAAGRLLARGVLLQRDPLRGGGWRSPREPTAARGGAPTPGSAAPIGAWLDRVHAEYLQPQRAGTTAMLALLALTLVEIARSQPSDEGVAAPPTRAARHLERFRALLERDLRLHRPVSGYAHELGITPTQLNRVCRLATGETALGLVHRRLVAAAEQELAYTSLSVKAVGLSLGFSDAAYFSRFFARATGRTPTAWRASARRLLETPRDPTGP